MSLSTVITNPVDFTNCTPATGVGVVSIVNDLHSAFYCAQTNRPGWAMATAGNPGWDTFNFSIEQNATPAEILNNKFLSAYSIGCSKTINRCFAVRRVSGTITVFGHNGTSYYEQNLNTGDTYQ